MRLKVYINNQSQSWKRWILQGPDVQAGIILSIRKGVDSPKKTDQATLVSSGLEERPFFILESVYAGTVHEECYSKL